MRLARAFVGQEKRGAFRLFRHELFSELGANLVGFLRDRRSNRGNDPFGSGADFSMALTVASTMPEARPASPHARRR